MNDLRFRWDPEKSRSNLTKHRVSFEDAALVFRDPLHLSWVDRIQDGEERWLAYGQVAGRYYLLVAHTTWEELQDGKQIVVVRIISARRAQPKERRRYEREHGGIHS